MDKLVDAAAAEGARATPTSCSRSGGQAATSWPRRCSRVPDGTKLPWYGPPMSAASMATARLMETWAHGNDVADALGARREPTARLRHVAHIGVRTRDFAYLVRQEPPPTEPFRVELTGPDGEVWTWGPADAAQRVTGPALDFCLLATQRVHRADTALVATGPDADQWLDIAQAFAGPPGDGREPKGESWRERRSVAGWTDERAQARQRRAREAGSRRVAEERSEPINTVRIGNASGFYGDRFAAMEEMLTGGDARLSHRGLPRRADHAHPRPGPDEGPGPRLRAHLPPPARGRARAGARARRQDRHQRGRAQPGRAGRRHPGACRPTRAAGSRCPRRRGRPARARFRVRSPPTPTSAAGASSSA